MADISTIHGPLDEGDLVKRVDSFNEELGTLTAIEYCLITCTGQAHVTGNRDAPEHFCSQHVHRSVNLAVKEGLEISGVLNALAGA